MAATRAEFVISRNWKALPPGCALTSKENARTSRNAITRTGIFRTLLIGIVLIG